MLRHHQQGVLLSGLVHDRTNRAELIDLAGKTAAGEGAEAATLQRWLRQRSGSRADGATPTPDAAEIPGLLGAGQLTWLAQFRAKRFDVAFLTMMATHHQGAVDIAETELRQGSVPELQAMARRIEQGHTTELRQLLAWKDAWS
jgi:uncharacterized protein (DUF305 family)